VARLPEQADLTSGAIYKVHTDAASDWRRPHLGASQIGKECLRALWYSFRWATPPSFDGRMLRLFNRGDREEAQLVDELTLAGVELHAVDFQGEQYRVSYHGGHFGGSCDGVGIGFPEAPKTWHLFEAKTANDRSWKDLKKKGVRESKPEHFDQMQTYMHGLKLKRAIYIAVNKNDDQLYVERVKFDNAHAEGIIAKAKMVIDAETPLSKISEDPSWYKCKWCDFSEICHDMKHDKVDRNCRTCVSATPTPNGEWHCEMKNIYLDVDAQRDGCNKHILIPDFVDGKPLKFDKLGRSLAYENGLVDHGGEIKHSGLLFHDAKQPKQVDDEH